MFRLSLHPLAWAGQGYGLADLGSSVGSGGKFGMASELDDEFFIESSRAGVGMMALGLRSSGMKDMHCENE
jgi:hypothetical protein